MCTRSSFSLLTIIFLRQLDLASFKFVYNKFFFFFFSLSFFFLFLFFTLAIPRGVLSTLKVVERKVDRVQTGLHSIGTTLKQKRKRNDTEEASGKLVIRCNTPPAVEEALQDVQAKVDLVYDKLMSETESNELNDQPESSNLPHAEAKLLNKYVKYDKTFFF